jgi:hypothetical protein
MKFESRTNSDALEAARVLGAAHRPREVAQAVARGLAELYAQRATTSAPRNPGSAIVQSSEERHSIRTEKLPEGMDTRIEWDGGEKRLVVQRLSCSFWCAI